MSHNKKLRQQDRRKIGWPIPPESENKISDASGERQELQNSSSQTQSGNDQPHFRGDWRERSNAFDDRQGLKNISSQAQSGNNQPHFRGGWRERSNAWNDRQELNISSQPQFGNNQPHFRGGWRERSNAWDDRQDLKNTSSQPQSDNKQLDFRGNWRERSNAWDDRQELKNISRLPQSDNNQLDFRGIWHEKSNAWDDRQELKNISSQPQSTNDQQTDLENREDNTKVDKKIDIINDTSNNLSTDFLSALQKNLFTDVSLKCGDYIQQAHKFVLAARSPVFEAMFTTPMEESVKGVVTINDIEASVLDDLLAFIYGGQVKNMTLSKGCDLLYVAEKYQVKGLKNICTHYLRSCLTIPNTIQILKFADLYDEALKQDVLNYVCANFTTLKTTEEWKALQSQKPNLSIEVYSMVVEKYEEQMASANVMKS